MSAVPAIRPRLASRWQSFEAWVGTRSSAVALFVLALAVFALQSIALPVYPGRDMVRYIQAFVQLGYETPVLPPVLNTRGPLAALGVGGPLELGGEAAALWLAVLYAASIVAWARVALTFGSRAAVLTAGLLLAYPGYSILFHELASDALFAAAFAGWAVLLSKAIQRPSIGCFLLVGLAMGLLVLIRPANQMLIVMTLLPLLLQAPLRRRLSWVAAFFVSSAAVTQSWNALAHLRYGDAVGLRASGAVLATAVLLSPLLVPPPWRRRFVLVVTVLVVGGVAVTGWRFQNPARYAQSVAQAPPANVFLFRAFELDRIVAPDNGPASRQLARAVERQLLTREPYRSYGINADEFFASGSDRVFGDLTSLGGSADLSAVTREAIRRHTWTFATSIAGTIANQLFTRRMYAPEPVRGDSSASSQQENAQYVVVDGRRLPRPSEGQPIPSSAIGPDYWAPGGGASEVWRSPTEHELVFADSRDQRRFEKFGRDTGRLLERIPTRDGRPELVHRLNQASHAFPPPAVWLAIGIIGLAVRRPRRTLVALAPSIAGLVIIVGTSFVAPAVPQYAAPVSAAFLLLAAAGLVGERADRRL